MIAQIFSLVVIWKDPVQYSAMERVLKDFCYAEFLAFAQLEINQRKSVNISQMNEMII